MTIALHEVIWKVLQDICAVAGFDSGHDLAAKMNGDS